MSFVVGKAAGSRPAEGGHAAEHAEVGKPNGRLDATVDPSALTLRSAHGAVRRLRSLVPSLEGGGQVSPMLALDARSALQRIDIAITQLRSIAVTRPDVAAELDALLADRAELAPRVERAQDPASAWRREAAPMAARLGLGAVDVRSDDDARSVTDAKGARGVALGSTVYMHPDRVQPGSDTGREVLAHELVHLAQARAPGSEADQGDRDAAELEAAELAPSLAGGSLARAPQRPIDLSRPAADADAAQLAAVLKVIKSLQPKTDAAWMYLKVNQDAFLAAFVAQVTKIPVVEHPRLKWFGNFGTKFREALLGWLRDRALFNEIKDLIRPVDPMRVIDQNRELSDGLPGKPSAVGKDTVGPLTWTPGAGTALAIEVAKMAQTSIMRMMPRYLVQVDEKHPQPVELADLVTSHPMDEVIARVLCDQSVVGQVGKPDRGKKKDDSPQAFRHGVRYLQNWKWCHETDIRLWNWLEVTDPADATPEDVAATIWAGRPDLASRADLITKAGRFFRIHPGYAHAMPHLAQHAPKDWYKPEEDNAIALAGSSFANEAAISSVAGLPKLTPKAASTPEKIAGYQSTLQRSLRQLRRMSSQLGRLNWMLGPAIEWADKHLDNIFAFPDDRYAALQPVIDGQQDILFQAAGAVEELAGFNGVRAEGEGPLVDVLREFAIAAGQSFIVDAGREHLARAKAKQGMLALDSADALLNDARAGVMDLSSSETKVFTYGGADAKLELAAHQKKLLEMRATVGAGGTIAAGDMEYTTAKLRELQFISKTRALNVKLAALADEARESNNDGMEVVANAFHGEIRDLPPKLYAIMTELRVWVNEPYEKFLRDEKDMAHAEKPGSPEDKLARARRINDQLDFRSRMFEENVTKKFDLEKIFSNAIETIQDARLYTMIFSIILLIAVGVAGGVVGSIVGGAVRGAMLATTATRTMGMLRAVNAARFAGTMANITADAAINTIGQRAILGNDGDSFLFNLATNAAVLTALRPLHRVAAAWKVPDLKLADLKGIGKAKAVAQVALKNTTTVTAEMLTGAGVSYALERAVKGPPKDEATAAQWVLQGAAMALGRFISGRMSKIEARLGELAMKDTGAWVRMRRVKATAFEVSKTGDAQKALDIAAEHQKVLEEEAAQIEDLIKTKRGKIPDDVLRAKLEGNLAEQKGVNKAALVPMQLHLAGLSADNDGGSVWYGTTEQIAIALHNARRVGFSVNVYKHDVGAREWSVSLEGQLIHFIEAPLAGRPRSATEMTDAELVQARRYADAAEFMQQQWERSLAFEINSRDVIEFDHLQVGYSIAGVMNQATMPSLGNGRGDFLVVYENRGTMSNRGQQEIGQDPKAWDGPGIRTSEQAKKGAPWARSNDLDRALTVARAELQTQAYQGTVVGLEQRPPHITDDWKAPNRKFRVKVKAAGEERWFYTDRYDNAGGMGPGLVHPQVTKAAGGQIGDMIARQQVVLGDDPNYFDKLKTGEILVWGGSPTGAWAAEPGVHAPQSRVDVVGDLRPQPGQPKKNWNDLIEAREAVMAQIAAGKTDPDLVTRKDAIEAELLEAHTGAALRRNRKPGATYEKPFDKSGKVRIEYGTPTKIEALPDGRVRVEMGEGATLKSKVYDQIVLAHGQNPGAPGGPGALLGKGAAETAPGSREYGDVPEDTIALRPVFSKDGKDVIALESIDPPGIRLVGAAYAHPAMAPWVQKGDHRKNFLDWFKRTKEANLATRDHGDISEDSTNVTPGMEHQRDKLPQANEALAAKAFKLPGPKATLVLEKGMTKEAVDAAVLEFLTIHLRADGEWVSAQRLGGGKSDAIVYLVKVGDHEVGVFKVFGHQKGAETEIAMLNLLAGANLQHMKVVAARGMAGVKPDSGFGSAMLMDKAPGTSVRDLIEAAGTHQDRAATMKKLDDAMVKVATGLAEMHTKFGQRKANGESALMTRKAKESDADYMVNRNFDGTTDKARSDAIRAALGADFDRVKTAIDGDLRDKFYAAEVPATAALGDANAGNFMLSKHDAARGYQDLSLIDVGAMKWSFDGTPTAGSKGKGTGAADLARFLGSLETMFPGHLQPHEVTALREKFMWAYLQHYKPGKTAEFQKNYADAEKWYRIEMELTVLADRTSSQYETKKRIMTMLGLIR